MQKLCKKINMTRLFVWQFAYRYFLHQLFPISGLVICYSKKKPFSSLFRNNTVLNFISLFLNLLMYRMYRSHHRLEKNEITCFSEKIVYIHYYYNQLQTKLFWSLKTIKLLIILYDNEKHNAYSRGSWLLTVCFEEMIVSLYAY